MKDPTAFRQRFAAWKDGKKPYENGRISDELYVETMEKVAHDNWQQWGDESEDAALTRILNDNSYDYRGYYKTHDKSAKIWQSFSYV